LTHVQTFERPVQASLTAVMANVGIGVIALVGSVGSIVAAQAYPVAIDESGFAVAGRAWRNGAAMYDTVYVDRPPPAIALFALVDWLLPRGAIALHIAAAIAAAATMLAIASIARRLGGHRVAVIAVSVFALFRLSHTAYVELSGEVLAGAFGAWAVALALRRDRALWYAGALAACAPLVKQSAVDAAMVCLLIAISGGGSLPARLRRMRSLVLGACIPVSLTLVHAAHLGFQRWIGVMALDRLRTTSIVNEPVISRLLPLVIWALLRLGLPLTIAALGLTRRRPSADGAQLIGVWTAISLAGMLLGGEFWQHYLLLPVIPVALLIGVGVDRLSATSGSYGRIAVMAALVGPVVAALVAISNPTLPSGTHEAAGQLLASVLPEDEPTLVLGHGTQLLYWADRPSMTPDLWEGWIVNRPGELQRLCQILISPDAPSWIVVNVRFAKNPRYTLDRQAKARQLLGVVESRYGASISSSAWQIRPLEPRRSEKASACPGR
jgi:4-amino-4-deoxy-L-arabinose transferase-like glycosyltransferase